MAFHLGAGTTLLTAIYPSAPSQVPATAQILQLYAQMRELLTNALILCLLIAVATLAVVQLIKPFVRAAVHHLILRLWLGKRYRHDALKVPDWLWNVASDETLDQVIEMESTPGEALARFSLLPTALYMRAIQSRANALMANPGRSPKLFAAIAADAPAAARAVVLYLHQLAKVNPTRVAVLGQATEAAPKAGSGPTATGDTQTQEPGLGAIDPLPPQAPPPSEIALSIAEARDAVAAAIEAGLDQLQLSILSTWQLVARLLGAGTGIVIAFTVREAVAPASSASVWLVGALGGLAATLLYEALRGLRRRPQ